MRAWAASVGEHEVRARKEVSAAEHVKATCWGATDYVSRYLL